MEAGLTRSAIITELAKSTHGKLIEYANVGRQAADKEPEFFAHLISWNRVHGQIRDSKVALPIVSLLHKDLDEEFRDNALAHVVLLNPRELLQAFKFAREVRPPSYMRLINRVISATLLEREKNTPRWDRTMLQHRRVIKELGALTHTDFSDRTREILFYGRYPAGSLFEIVANLKNMSAAEAAGTIMEKKIPFLIASGALGNRAKDPDVVLALIQRMSATELVTNTKMLERLGMKTNPALRGAYNAQIEKAGKSTANLLKTTQAIENIEDEETRDKLRGLQEKQIAASGGVEGNWLILGDKSGSMETAIEISRQVAATLSKLVRGNVRLIFFDTVPTGYDVTGKSLDQIRAMTKHIIANGGTSIGCGLQYLLLNKEEIDGIAIISDGGENTAPYFHNLYAEYSHAFSKKPSVYFYKVAGQSPDLFSGFMNSVGHAMDVFDLRGKETDFYSLPNLAMTMRANRFSLVDEIMQASLLKLSDVYKACEAKAARA